MYIYILMYCCATVFKIDQNRGRTSQLTAILDSSKTHMCHDITSIDSTTSTKVVLPCCQSSCDGSGPSSVAFLLLNIRVPTCAAALCLEWKRGRTRPVTISVESHHEIDPASTASWPLKSFQKNTTVTTSDQALQNHHEFL